MELKFQFVRDRLGGDTFPLTGILRVGARSKERKIVVPAEEKILGPEDATQTVVAAC